MSAIHTPDIPVQAGEIDELRARAKNIRRKVLRMAAGKGQGYVGQGLGVADILAAVYFGELRYDPADPEWAGRDRFLLSVGHYSIALFAALAEAGTLPEDELDTYGADGSRLEMSSLETTPGVEVTGGSLAHGLGVACGMALGARLARRDFRVFNLLSDGELQEGATWEAAMFAAHHSLGNLTALVDVNRTQADGDLVLEVEPVAEKLRAFGWWAIDVDGNDVGAVHGALVQAREQGERPRALVCHTRLGYGVPLIMERERAHFVRVGDDEWEQAMQQLEQGS
jgi:transketolase